MKNNCIKLNNATNVDEYIETIEKMMDLYGTTTNVEIDASHHNVEFFIENTVIDALQDYNGSLMNLCRIFVGLKSIYGNALVQIDSGYNNASWFME